MTYEDLYDQWLKELYEDKLADLPLWVTDSKTPAELMKENSPIDYRCGYASWSNTLCESPPTCSVCGKREVDPHHAVNDCAMEDEVMCGVCEGTHFECENCGGVKPNDKAANKDMKRCVECANPEEIDEGSEA